MRDTLPVSPDNRQNKKEAQRSRLNKDGDFPGASQSVKAIGLFDVPMPEQMACTRFIS